MKQSKVHPAADAFPMMNTEQYEGLRDDIAERGQQEAIVYWKGELVDGRNRLKACRELGIEPTECELDDDVDPVAYIISANLHRRHLTTPQRSMVAAKLATLKNGRPKETPSNDEVSRRADAAKLLQVSTASVDRAKYVVTNGSKDLVQAVERGELNLNQATKLVKSVPDKREQSKIVRDGKEAVKAAVQTAKPKVEESPSTNEPSEPDDYDYPAVKAFANADYRLNTLRRIVELLDDHEREVLKDWLIV